MKAEARGVLRDAIRVAAAFPNRTDYHLRYTTRETHFFQLQNIMHAGAAARGYNAGELRDFKHHALEWIDRAAESAFLMADKYHLGGMLTRERVESLKAQLNSIDERSPEDVKIAVLDEILDSLDRLYLDISVQAATPFAYAPTLMRRNSPD